MASKVLFSNMEYEKYEKNQSLPAKFERLIDAMDISGAVHKKSVVIKMHLGRNIGYTTIHPLFIKILVDKLKGYESKVFIADQSVSGARSRGYTEDYLDCPIVDVCGVLGKYFYPKDVDYKTFKNVDIGGHIYDADVMIDLSHVKGHGACGYGGACKNIAMGCVTDRTRQQIHHLEGGITWDESKCTRCKQCVDSCNHGANEFNKDDKYEVFFHHCTFCQHCVKVCPTEALSLDSDSFRDFQTGMALCTKEVLDTFKPDSVFYINFLMSITALCDCWGFSTASLVPDIGIMASNDIVAIERACIDAIKVENLIKDGVPTTLPFGSEGHLFERLHGKNPYIQLEELVKYGLGTQEYFIEEIK